MNRDFEDHCWKDVMPASMLEVYRHYQREIYVGRQPALLAIDLYELAYQGGPGPVEEVSKQYPSACGRFAYDAIEPTKALFAAARKAELPIIYTTSDVRPDSRPTKVTATNRQKTPIDPELYAIRSDFAAQPDDVVIRKQRASAFFGTPLVAHLTQLGVQSLLICGESTSGCVRASAVDAYSHGFHVVLVEECCFDRCEISHKVNLFDMHHKYCDVMHIEDVLSDLDARIGRRAAAE